VRFARALGPTVQLQYLEEPVNDPAADLASFCSATGVHAALDETLDEAARGCQVAAALLAQLGPQDGVTSWVLKPSVLGGAERTLALADRAHARGMRAVVSCAFESPLGLAGLVHLAAVVDARAKARR
jgi:O-succinylbenzoate synthase